MIHFKEVTSSKKTKSAKEKKIKINVGDHVSLFDEKKTCFIEKIRILATGKMVEKYNGIKNDIVLTFKGLDYQQNIWLAHLDFDE